MIPKMNIRITIIFLLSFSTRLSAQQIIDEINYDENRGYYLIRYHYEENSTGQSELGTLMPGDHVDPQIRATVENVPTNEYEYSYALHNGDRAQQALYAFALKTKSPIRQIKSPTVEWDGVYIERKSEISWVKTGGRIPGIKAGDSVNGFTFISSDLPSIIKSYSNNYIWMSFPGEEPVGILESVVDSLLDNRMYVIHKTIGPRQISKDIGNKALLDTLNTYLAFSCDTTWIPTPGTCRSLRSKLEEAKDYLMQGDPPQAQGVMQVLLNEVESLPQEQLSPEARALLYYNGKFLLGRLGEER